jgi:hypothetical protein
VLAQLMEDDVNTTGTAFGNMLRWWCQQHFARHSAAVCFGGSV